MDCPIFLWFGDKDSPTASVCSAGKERKAPHDERNISSHSSHRKTPTLLIWEGRLTHLLMAPLWQRRRKAVHGQRGFFMPYAVPWKDPPFPQFSGCNLLSSDFCFSDSLACCHGNGKEKQCVMRGASHPRAHTGRSPFVFNLGGRTHPLLQLVSLQKEQIRNTW